jgi:hypothetical protein
MDGDDHIALLKKGIERTFPRVLWSESPDPYVLPPEWESDGDRLMRIVREVSCSE